MSKIEDYLNNQSDITPIVHRGCIVLYRVDPYPGLYVITKQMCIAEVLNGIIKVETHTAEQLHEALMRFKKQIVLSGVKKRRGPDIGEVMAYAYSIGGHAMNTKIQKNKRKTQSNTKYIPVTDKQMQDDIENANYNAQRYGVYTQIRVSD